jgi:hypothetical protein
MNTHADKTSENKSQAAANDSLKQHSDGELTFQLANSQKGIAQKKLWEAVSGSPRMLQSKTRQEIADSSPPVKQLRAYQDMANNFTSQSLQRKENIETGTPQGKPGPMQKKENNTGLPDNLKSGVENLSGYSLDDVKVHYNSDKPAHLQAHAYAQGSDIHVASGQEKHLAHEAWHVVQQKQGRVKPTLQMKGETPINDDTGLEKEADLMGAKALQMKTADSPQSLINSSSAGVTQFKLVPGRLNVAGEDHEDSSLKAIRGMEEQYAADVIKGKYWKEDAFPASPAEPAKPADTYMLQITFILATLKQYNITLAKQKDPDRDIVRNWCGNMHSECEDLIAAAGKAKQVNEAEAVTWYARNERDVQEMTAILDLASKIGFSPAKQIGEILALFEPIPTRKAASLARGNAMHSAANRGVDGGAAGIWKIGQAHIDEIESTTEASARKYTTTSAAEFDRDFVAWIKEEEKAKKPEAAKTDYDIDPNTGKPMLSADELLDGEEDPWAD